MHAVRLAFFWSAGQASPAMPGQVSTWSHSPAAARQTKALERTTSLGQVALVPVQVSSGSHTSPEPWRPTAPALPAGCWHASLVPSQVSVVQGLPSSVQAVLAACFASAGQPAPATPGHISAWSHSPAAGRQTTVLDAGVGAGQVVLVPVQYCSGSQTSPEPA